MNRRTIIHWGVLCFFAAPAIALAQTTLAVPSSYPSIQAAIDAASPGDTVLVSPGIYQEFLDFRGKAITVKSLAGPEQTTIDGVNPFAANAKSLVTFSQGEGASSVLDGFRLFRGGGNLVNNWYLGGAIFCDASSPTIKNNIILANIASFGGGIACINAASPRIENNVIGDLLGNGNVAIDGGGIYCQFFSSPTIEKNLIAGNMANPYCQYGNPPNPSGFGSQAGVAPHSGIYVPGDAGFPSWSPGSGPGSGGSAGGGFGGFGQSCIGGHGGGIFCANQSVPSISKNEIVENSAGAFLIGGQGGGIYCEKESDALIFENTVLKNSSIAGGGIGLHSSSPQIAKNKIEQNSAPLQGAGISCVEGSSASIQNNVIRENVDANRGGGIFVDLSAPVIISNKISKHAVVNSGGGIYVSNTTESVLLANNMIWENEVEIGNGAGIFFAGLGAMINNTICKNSAPDYGGGLMVAQGSPLIENNIFWANDADQIFPLTAPVNYCLVQDGFPGWNLAEAPYFVNFENNNFHLQSGSPAIDAGNLGIVGLPLTDFEGDSRIIGNGVDIGADEFRPSPFGLYFKHP